MTSQDFEQFPAWESALNEEGQDKATVRHYSIDGPLDAAEGMFLVRADLVLADGTWMAGCLTPYTARDSGIGGFRP